MKILVTAGNTQALIDQVRCITNIFSGRTGARLAIEAHRREHEVTLLTSHPEAVDDLDHEVNDPRWRMQAYDTFEDLQKTLEQEVKLGKYDAIIHSAAVSDYLCSGVYVPAQEKESDTETGRQGDKEKTVSLSPRPLVALSQHGKVKSSHQDLWLRLTPAPKLIDFIRQPWGFRGLLVKFKLEVGIGEKVLEQIAEESRLQSQADLLVANTLEGRHDWALMGAKEYRKVERQQLPKAVIDFLERENKQQRI